MSNEAIDSGVVAPAPHDQKPVVPQNLQQIGVQAEHPEEKTFNEVSSPLSDTGAVYTSPDAPHTIATGESHAQFEAKPKFSSENAAKWGDTLLNQKKVRTEEYKASKGKREGGFLRLLANPFGILRREKLPNAT